MSSEKNWPTEICLSEDQVQHQEQDRRAQEVDGRALDEAEGAEVAHLLELELEDLVRRRVEAIDLLIREPEALHELDVAERFRRRAGERGRLRDDDLLHRLDLACSAPSSVRRAAGS